MTGKRSGGVGAYVELAKPRITSMVVATALIGYRMAGGRGGARMVWTLIGVALASAATGTLNQYLESDRDGLMRRTRSRPLPSGRLKPRLALAFGTACGLAGAAVLRWKAGAPACDLAVFTMLSYLFLYTPLKSRTPQCVWVGAVAGAMPPLVGWAAASGAVEPRAWALFAIQFLWQIPHFTALFWLHREDYARAGFKLAPVLDPGGRTTAAQIAVHSFTLLPASLMPTLCGLASPSYGAGALALSGAFLILGMRASWTLGFPDTRRLFLASLAYLPVLFGMLILAA